MPDLALYELAAADPDVRFSPHCWKTRMALAHKGLQARGIPWRFTEKEALGPSGQGLVPVLVHDGAWVHDSWRIALHLERHFPERPSLFGAEAAVPLAEFVNRWADSALMPLLGRLAVPYVHQGVHAQDRAYFRSTREQRFGVALETLAAERDGYLAALQPALQPLRLLLAGRDFIAGARPAYADYCVFGQFVWAHCTCPLVLLEESDPVHAWRERLFDAFGGLARAAPTMAH